MSQHHRAPVPSTNFAEKKLREWLDVHDGNALTELCSQIAASVDDPSVLADLSRVERIGLAALCLAKAADVRAAEVAAVN